MRNFLHHNARRYSANWKDQTLARATSLLTVVAALLHFTAAQAQVTTTTDPTIGFTRLFGLGGHACKQYDDTGRLYIYSEGLPSLAVISWLQRSDNGTKANISMPEELAQALPRIPGCLPGKHHAAAPSGRSTLG